MTDIDKPHRDRSPKLQLFVAEYGGVDEEEASARLAFHTYEEAEVWLEGTAHVDAELETVGNGTWRAERNIGNWKEIRRTRVSQPRRLLRDDRER